MWLSRLQIGTRTRLRAHNSAERRQGLQARLLVPDTIPPVPCRIERGNYLADVLQAGDAEPFWYYVIQRKCSNEVIDLVKFDTYEQALKAATQVLVKMNEAITAKREGYPPRTSRRT